MARRVLKKSRFSKRLEKNLTLGRRSYLQLWYKQSSGALHTWSYSQEGRRHLTFCTHMQYLQCHWTRRIRHLSESNTAESECPHIYITWAPRGGARRSTRYGKPRQTTVNFWWAVRWLYIVCRVSCEPCDMFSATKNRCSTWICMHKSWTMETDLSISMVHDQGSK